jgi:hypothetical protein
MKEKDYELNLNNVWVVNLSTNNSTSTKFGNADLKQGG